MLVKCENSPPRSPRSPINYWRINPRDLAFTHKLGEGSFSSVYKGSYKGQDVAIKILKVRLKDGEMDPKAVRDFEYECSIMSKVHSPFIVKFYGACLEPRVTIVTEYCSRGSLFDLMQDKTYRFQWPSTLLWCKQIACAVLSLHSANPSIFHRDLKSANILIDRDWCIKVCDFGSGREDLSFIGDATEDSHASLGKVRGTYAYSDPNLFRGTKYTTKSDIYSMGIVMWELVTRTISGQYSKPYPGMEGVSVLLKAYHQQLRPKICEDTPASLAQLIRKCWDALPSERPTAEGLLQKLQDISREYETKAEEWEDILLRSAAKEVVTTGAGRDMARKSAAAPLSPADMSDLNEFQC